MQVFKKILEGTVKVTEFLLMILLFGLVALILNELILRNFFDKSFSGMTELAGFMFLWIAFLGIVVLFYNDKLIRLDMLYVRMDGRLKQIVWFLQQAVAFALGVTMIAAFVGLYPFISTDFYSSMPKFSKMWQYLPMAISGAFMAICVLYNVLDKILGTREGAVK